MNDQSKSSSDFRSRNSAALNSPLELAVAADRQLVLEDQLQKLTVAQAMAGSLLQADFQTLQQAGEAELLQRFTQGFVHW